MKISKIIDELTELQKYIGDKELEACIANAATTGVNVMYQNDDGGITSTSLEGEKIANLIKETTSDQEALAEFNVKVLHLDLCDGSADPDIVARADVEVTNDTSFLSINGLDLKYNDVTREYSIVAPKSLSGVCINELTQRAVTSAVVARYEQIIGKFPKHVWIEFVSDELKDKLFKLKSDNGIVPLGTVDEIVQLFVNDIEKIGNALEKEREKLKSHSLVEFPTNVGG